MTAIPEGYALVPIEPTEAMKRAAEVWRQNSAGVLCSAIIAAAPKPVTDDGHSFERA